MHSQRRFQRNGIADDLDGNCFTFRQRSNFSAGSVFSIGYLDKTLPFNASVRIYPGCLDENGDGVVFVFQPIGPFAGSFNQRLGNKGLAPSLGIELDLDPNPEDNDPSYDHIAILLNGVQDHISAANLAGPVRALNQLDNVEDCEVHFMNIEWSPQSKMLDVYFDCQLRLSREIRFEDYFGEQKIHWGVTVGVKGGAIEYSVCPDHIEQLVNTSSVSICRGNSTTLRPTRTAEVFKWYADSILIAEGQNSLDVMPFTNTNYHLLSRDSCGRQYLQDYLVVVQADSLPLDLGPPDSLLCEGTEIILEGNIDKASYIWQDGSRESSFVVRNPGLYKVVASLGHCMNTDSILVVGEQSELLNWSVNISGCEGENLELSTGLSRHYSHNWSDGSIENQIIVNQSGVYSVQIQSICEEFELKTEVELLDCDPIYFPNSFSPNNDNINDLFRIGSSIDQLELLDFLVLDRWGTLIWQLKEVYLENFPGWDGRMSNGQDAPAGLFVLYLNLKLPNGSTRKYVKDFVLYR